jgi:hypothetical protein
VETLERSQDLSAPFMASPSSSVHWHLSASFLGPSPTHPLGKPGQMFGGWGCQLEQQASAGPGGGVWRGSRLEVSRQGPHF